MDFGIILFLGSVGFLLFFLAKSVIDSNKRMQERQAQIERIAVALEKLVKMLQDEMKEE